MAGDNNPTGPGPTPSHVPDHEQPVTAPGIATTPLQETRPGTTPETRPGGTALNTATVQARLAAIAVSVPGYEILGELGRGGMGVVYKAKQQSLNRLVALKMILAAGSEDDPAVARFLTEAEAVAAIRHPNVVQVYDFGKSDGQPFMALEYLAGGTLAERLRDLKQLPPNEAAAVVEKIARGVQAAHAKGIIHRDLKPGNVLFDEGGEPKVADFGLAKRADSDLTRTGAIMGTPAYMAPEQADGHTREVGPAADVWSIGVILYECLTGNRPFVAKRTDELLVKVLMADPDPLRSRTGGIPRALETICLKCLEKNPARRYSSALALAQDLERFLAGEPILARPESALQKVWRRVRRRALTITLAVALLLTAGIAAALVMRSSPQRRVNEIVHKIDEGLDASEWPEGHRDNLEKLAEQLEPLDPEQAKSEREKIQNRVAKRMRAVLGRDRVTPEDVQALDSELRWLAARNRTLADQLQVAVQGRVRSWQPLVPELAKPFTELNKLFPQGGIRVSGESLLPAENSQSDTVRTGVSSVGEVRLEAEFAAAWFDIHEIGLGIDTTPGMAGYQYMLVAVARRLPAELAESAKAAPKPTLSTFRETDGHAEIRILRDGIVLRQQPIRVSEGTLRLMAERDGDQLRMQVNGTQPLLFMDIAPIAGRAESVFALTWPNRVPLNRFRLLHRPVPREPSPLEKADDLYARGDFAAALVLYQQQARSADTTITAEARCKAGLCLVALNRLDDAVVEFEATAASPGDRWPVIAVVQLALIQLQQKRFDKADELFSTAAVRSTPEQVARYVSAEVRNEILGQPALPASAYVLPTAAAVRRAEARYKLYEVFGVPSAVLGHRYDLGRAHALIGEDEKAEREFGEIIREITSDPLGVTQPNWVLPWSVRWFSWIKVRRGGPDAALVALAPLLRALDVDGNTGNTPVPPAAAGVMTTVARLNILRGKPELAAADLERILKSYSFDSPHAYLWWAEAWLLKGFLEAHKGDEVAAKAAWKNSTLTAFAAARNRVGVNGSDTDGRGYGLYYRLLTGSLSGSLTDEEATQIWHRLLQLVADEQLLTQIAATVQISPAVLRGMWASPRGREWARKVIFLEIHPVDLTRVPLRLIGYEKLRQDLFNGKPTPEQDEILWQTVQRFGDLFFEGKLTKIQMFPLALAWKGTIGTFGWGALAPLLQPEVRGPLAYSLGVRFVKLNQPGDARVLFNTAKGDAPPNSPLAKLAAEELAKLDSPPKK